MISRQIASRLLTSLEFFPVTLLHGPRQVGKSFLLHSLKREGKLSAIVTLADLTVLVQAKTNPHAFIENLPKPVRIDEIQRAPELMLALKKYVDENKRAGDFVLTGSVNIT